MSDIVKKLDSLVVTDREGTEDELKVGDLLIGSYEIYEIWGFEVKGDTEWILHSPRDESYTDQSKMSLSDYRSYYKVLKGTTKEEIEDIAEKILTGEYSIDDLKEEDNSTSREMGLMKVDKEFYSHTRDKLVMVERKVNAIRKVVKEKTDAIQRRMNAIIQAHAKVIKRLNSIIFTIELYAGIQEKIKQIQSGEFASNDEPIYLNQQMKFMDEEVGDPSNGGISFDSLDKFDDWLLSKNEYTKEFNYELLLPQQKCVRVMRVRRYAQEKYLRHRDIWGNSWEVDKEMKTYILIRNGENFYTISSKMGFSEKLFPTIEELTKILEIEDEGNRFDAMEKYKNGMFLMQGLVDRSTVFGDVAGEISFLTSKSMDEGKVIFQYELDEDKMVTDGTKTFIDFLESTTLKTGDRVLLIDASHHEGHGLFRYYSNPYSMPNDPEDGVYELEWREDYNTHYIRYKDTRDDYYDEETHEYRERKNKVSLKVNIEHNSVVNIDAITHRNIDWIMDMLHDRRDRRKYLKSVGLLLAIKHWKSKELNEEKPFAQMLMSASGKDELTVLDAIHWWKTKNKYKRTLLSDDQKAYRMIMKELQLNR